MKPRRVRLSSPCSEAEEGREEDEEVLKLGDAGSDFSTRSTLLLGELSASEAVRGILCLSSAWRRSDSRLPKPGHQFGCRPRCRREPSSTSLPPRCTPPAPSSPHPLSSPARRSVAMEPPTSNRVMKSEETLSSGLGRSEGLSKGGRKDLVELGCRASIAPIARPSWFREPWRVSR